MQDSGLIVANAFGSAGTAGRVENESSAICGGHRRLHIRQNAERNYGLKARLARDQDVALDRVTLINGYDGSPNPQAGQRRDGKECRVLEQDSDRAAGRYALLDTASQYQRCPVDLTIGETDLTVIDSRLFRMATGNLIEACADRLRDPGGVEWIERHLHGTIVIQRLPGGREPLQMRSQPGPVFIRSKRNRVAPQALRAETPVQLSSIRVDPSGPAGCQEYVE
jgi:hypothetical protein